MKLTILGFALTILALAACGKAPTSGEAAANSNGAGPHPVQQMAADAADQQMNALRNAATDVRDKHSAS